MFKAIKESPPITEMLLSEGKDFLRLCFQRNPADRPSVSTLLEHHFVRNSQQLDVPLHLAFNGMTLIDRAPSPRELPSFKLDQMPMSPTRHAAANVHLISSNGVDGRRRLGESLRGKTAHNQDRHKFMRTSLIFGDVEIPASAVKLLFIDSPKPTDALSGELWDMKERIRKASICGKLPGWDLCSGIKLLATPLIGFYKLRLLVIVKSGDDCACTNI
ncbi:hypothetical protein Dimus_012058 [Dionaea muscipula]